MNENFTFARSYASDVKVANALLLGHFFTLSLNFYSFLVHVTL